MLLLSDAAVLAAEDADSGRRLQTVLEIASDFAGSGMDRPYADGYMPDVTDGAAHVVLPLRPSDPEAAPETINVSVNLGDPSAPFVFQNYDVQVPLGTVSENSSPIYMIDMHLPLEENAAAGRYPVAFTCSGQAGGRSFSQTFTVYVTVPGEPEDPGEADPGSPDPGPEYSAAPDSGGDFGGEEAGGAGSAGGSGTAAEPTAVPQPKLMIVAQTVSPSPVSAGSRFSLSLTLLNTSSTVPVSNLLVSVDSDSSDVYAPDGQNSAYFPQIRAGGTVSFSAVMTAAAEAEPGPKKILLHAGYDGPSGAFYVQDDSVAVQIVQPVRFEVDEPDVPDTIPAGETWALSVNVMNLGRSAIRNVSAQVAAPGIRAQNTLFLGNLDSGTARKGTLYAFVGPKEDAEGQARYGKTSGLLTVSCEDEAGTAYTQELPFALSIEAPVIRSQSTPEPQAEPEPAMHWQTALIAGGALAALGAWLWLRHRAREKTADEDE